jgi:hypothetical protein
MAAKGFNGHDIQTMRDPDNPRRNYYTCRNCGIDSKSLLEWETTPRCTGTPRR